LLVSSDDEINRTIFLQKLEEEIISSKQVNRLSVNEFSDGTQTTGWHNLDEFHQNYHAVSFCYNAWAADVEKKVCMIVGKNAVIVSYKVSNKMLEKIRFKVNLLVNYRSIFGLQKEGAGYELKIHAKNILGLGSKKGYMTVYSDKAECAQTKPEEKWIKSVLYSEDQSRGDSCIEDMHFPAYYFIDIPAMEKREFMIVAIAYDSEEKTAACYKELSKGYSHGGRIMGEGLASSLMALFSAAESFVIKKKNNKTVIAGYHWFGEWGRDSMISLPGLTLVNGRLENAEAIFRNFLDNAGPLGIANKFEAGKPVYTDYDSTLWAIDRLYQYSKYAGSEKTLEFIIPYWPKLKQFVSEYSKLEKNGFLIHKSGTWMDTLERNNAVEVQALWYNSLKIMQKFAKLMGDKKYDVSGMLKRFEHNFYEVYWNTKYLNDCLGDKSLRPNQVIAISLDHHTVPEESCRKILEIVEKELLTPYGLRTLSPNDSRYSGQYSGGIPEREHAYHNGTVWPWLMGPYIKSKAKYSKEKDWKKGILEPLFEHHIKEAGIGSISEILDGDFPHNPRGCISQAWSVAEPLRAYMEDVLGKKPPYSL